MTDHVDPRIEAAAIALYVAVQPKFRTPEGWDGIAGLWKREYRTHATAALAAADKAATIATVEEMDALTQGALVSCENANPAWPDVFLHTGGKRDPWLALDPSDRDDGERTLDSGTVLRWHGKGEARVIRWGTE